MTNPEPPYRLHADKVTLAHGGGGKAMRDLIEDVFLRHFKPETMEDQARLVLPSALQSGGRLAFTTDSYVVKPLFFPGGDIGTMAINGTVNDLAVGGAVPLCLSAGFIIEEGCSVDLLRQVAASMQKAAEEAGVHIVTGDTKVVERGAADTLFINTAGIGVIPEGVHLAAERVEVGDVAIVNGVLGDHGAAILAARGDMALTTDIRSDCQPLHHLMQKVRDAAPGLHAARDATRGGLASALNEIAMSAGVGISVSENLLPLRAEVKGVCEILGLDPLYLANEGTLVLFVPEAEAEAALKAMRQTEAGREAVIIGKAVSTHPGVVVMDTVFGGGRVVDMLVGEQLPRIC